jgi:hypothetical protein
VILLDGLHIILSQTHRAIETFTGTVLKAKHSAICKPSL